MKYFMLPRLLSFAAGMLTFVGYVVAFLVIRRLRPRIGWFALQIITGGAIHIISTILCLFLLKGFVYWYALGIFAVGWFCFFTLSTAVYVSISAKILCTIYKTSNRAMTTDEIFEICIQHPFVKRVKFLLAASQIRKGKTGYQITSTGEKNVKVIRAMRKILNLDGSGIYSREETMKFILRK